MHEAFDIVHVYHVCFIYHACLCRSDQLSLMYHPCCWNVLGTLNHLQLKVNSSTYIKYKTILLFPAVILVAPLLICVTTLSRVCISVCIVQALVYSLFVCECIVTWVIWAGAKPNFLAVVLYGDKHVKVLECFNHTLNRIKDLGVSLEIGNM